MHCYGIALLDYSDHSIEEMSARLGIITRQGLGEALRKQFTNKFVKVISVILVISAIVIGTQPSKQGTCWGLAGGRFDL